MRIKDIIIRFIPHNKQNYDTCGDYGEIKGWTWFNISRMKDWRYMMLVLVHEIIEFTLCRWRRIKLKDINEFDIGYEKARQNNVLAPCGCLPTETSQPGFDIHSPYYHEHTFADKIEMALAKELDVDANNYENAINQL